MSRLRVLVADDEPLAREMLQAMIEADTELTVVGVAADGRQAAAEIERLEPDLVLLDIEMPEASGLEAVRDLAVERQPIFIFVTAYDHYATEAFDIEALDYVLKPVSEVRLAKALDRAKRRIRQQELISSSGMLRRWVILSRRLTSISQFEHFAFQPDDFGFELLDSLRQAGARRGRGDQSAGVWRSG